MNNIFKLGSFLLVVGALSMTSCQSASGNKTGSEYMPDMGHSIAYEANVFDYYKYNRWGTSDDLHEMSQPRKPVDGTIPRGMAGTIDNDSRIMYHANGHVPYYYDNTEEERERATREIINNPYPITQNGLARGKDLYVVMCGICHGDKADGNGYLVREDGGVYPVQPSNFMLDDFVSSSNGRYYHAIMYGKNMMGSYSDKLSYEERWQVIHYIRSLQAEANKMEYNENVNTFNNDVPLSKWGQKKVEAPLAEVMTTDDNADSE